VGQAQGAEGQLEQAGQQRQLHRQHQPGVGAGQGQGASAAAVSRLVRATGPVLSWGDEPNRAATMLGSSEAYRPT
jgi:hypothetical protein